MTGSLPDAAPTNWVDRHAPPRLRPWLKLGRFDRPTGIWLLMLPGWQGIALAAAMRHGWLPSLRLLALFAVGAALMRAAGCAYNDIIDRDIDARVARTAGRPIPAGQIAVRDAWLFVLACAGASFAILLTLGPLTILLGFASLALVAVYPFMKRITWWPQAWLGLTFNWGVLMGFATAAPGASPLSPWPAILLYASGIFWTLGYDTIYATQDLEDDALVGVKSSARRLGTTAPRVVLAFYVASVALALASWRVAGIGLLFLPFATIFAANLILQAIHLRPADPQGALKLFKLNTQAGVWLFFGLAVGNWRF